MCCALLRFGGADLGGRSRAPATRERSAHKRTPTPSAQSAAMIQDALVFPAPVEWRSRKRSGAVAWTPDQLTSLLWIIRNLGSGTQKPVPRLRRMQERRALAQARKRRCLCISCAIARKLLCKSRGKAAVLSIGDRMHERRARTQVGNLRSLCISCARRTIVVQITRKSRAIHESLLDRA